jgi:hypothetical protein
VHWDGKGWNPNFDLILICFTKTRFRLDYRKVNHVMVQPVDTHSWPDFIEIPNSVRLMPVKQVMRVSRRSTRLSLVLATLVAVGYHST